MGIQYALADLLAIGRQSLRIFLQILPYVLAGALLSASLMTWRGKWLDARLGRFTALPILPAVTSCALLGTLSPLCTLGTVPVVVGLLRMGLHPGAGIAFLTGSSLINPQIFLIMLGTIGIPMALTQWGVSLLTAVGAGLLAGRLDRHGMRVFRELGTVKIEASCPRSRKSFWQTLLDQLEFVLIYILIGVILGATVNVLVPGGVLSNLFHYARTLGVAVAAIASVPLYVCGGGILPLLAELMDAGMPGGLVLAFITAGPATRFQSLAAIAVLLRSWSLAAYVLLIWLSASLAGFAWNSLFA